MSTTTEIVSCRTTEEADNVPKILCSSVVTYGAVDLVVTEPSVLAGSFRETSGGRFEPSKKDDPEVALCGAEIVPVPFVEASGSPATLDEVAL